MIGAKMVRLASTLLLVSGCATDMRYSYVDPEITDQQGVFAATIADVALRHDGAVSVVEASSDNSISGSIVSSMQNAGVEVSDNAEPLRYYISKLYDGFLLRVHHLGTWTAQFFRIADGDYAKAGPTTHLKRS